MATGVAPAASGETVTISSRVSGRRPRAFDRVLERDLAVPRRIAGAARPAAISHEERHYDEEEHYLDDAMMIQPVL